MKHDAEWDVIDIDVYEVSDPILNESNAEDIRESLMPPTLLGEPYEVSLRLVEEVDPAGVAMLRDLTEQCERWGGAGLTIVDARRKLQAELESAGLTVRASDEREGFDHFRSAS